MGPAEKDLFEGIQRALPFGHLVVRLERVAVAPRVERLLLRLNDETERICIWKRSNAQELLLYRDFLGKAETGAPSLQGALEDRAWLFLEALPEAFPDFTDPEHVARVYRHLGGLHRRLAREQLPPLPSGSPWTVTAAEVTDTLSAVPLASSLAGEAAALLAGGPATLIQGDYHRWNLAIDADQVRVWDWEHAAVTHPVWDLVLLAPEEPGWDGAPRGALAELALRTYHREGLLADRPWKHFLRLQQLARLFVAARWARAHEARAAAVPAGPQANVIRSYAQQEIARVEAMAMRVGKADA